MRQTALLSGSALACALALCCAGCTKTVLSGEDPDVARPTATGDDSRDRVVINVPWMEPPVPRILVDGQPIVAERVSGLTPENDMRYMMRTTKGATASILIKFDQPSPDVMEFIYEVQSLPPGYTLDLPIGLGDIGRRGPIAVAVNGVPFHASPTADVAIVELSRDHKTRIQATRLKTLTEKPQ